MVVAIKLHYYAEFRKIKETGMRMKGKLKQKFADLTDDDLLFEEEKKKM
jgi:uncharacterized protein YjbJ (UPF0337 family)